MWNSQIMRLTRPINQVDDAVIGGGGAGISGAGKFAGQLGQKFWIDPANLLFTASVGTVYGGYYQYVRYRSADAPAPVVGQIAFWDTTVTNWSTAYQITREEDLSTATAAVFPAGIFISIPTAGNYCYIFIGGGQVPIKFRAALTSAGAIGSNVYAAGANDGADEGLADVLSSGANPTFADVRTMQARYLGTAIAAPGNGSLTNVHMPLKNVI